MRRLAILAVIRVAVMIGVLATAVACFGQGPRLSAKIEVPASPVKLYSLVRVSTDSTARYLDLLVMTVQNGSVQFVETVQTTNQGEWVFTGPAGEYSLRLTTFDQEAGITTATGRVTIGAPAPSPDPPKPPEPPQPPTPPPAPVPDGVYGFGPLSYTEGMKVAAASRSKAAALADNFDSVAAQLAAGGDVATPQDALREIGGRNNLTLTAPADAAAWTPWRAAWKAKADALNASGKLTNKPEDYVTAFRETAVGLRAVK